MKLPFEIRKERELVERKKHIIEALKTAEIRPIEDYSYPWLAATVPANKLPDETVLDYIAKRASEQLPAWAESEVN